jgi:hypothetical protein
MMKIMVMMVIAMVMTKCSGLEKRRKRKIKWAQGKGDIHRDTLFSVMVVLLRGELLSDNSIM